MTAVKLRISELRKAKGISQQDLAGVLGVSFQSVSKWETGATMPDITLLPAIAEYFEVSVDELLGLKPLQKETYIPRDSDNRDGWNGKTDRLYKNRKYFWNDDYMRFLVKDVWKVDSPVDVIELRCGEGYLGRQLLDILPEGSTYTGVDNEYFTTKAKECFKACGKRGEFIVSDIYSLDIKEKYDMAICQAGLRHMNRPLQVMERMKAAVKKGGLVACIDVNREFENDGLYFDEMSYYYLCTAFDLHKVWNKELECEGRDYAIGMRLPFYMRQLGLKDIDIRMNDSVMYANPDLEDYEEKLHDFIEINGWNEPFSLSSQESTIELFMNRGLDRAESEAYVEKQFRIAEYFGNGQEKKSFLKVQGLLIAYGWK